MILTLAQIRAILNLNTGFLPVRDEVWILGAV
jgi:hypothetical protein